METLEFVIYPDGRVVERVTGISGSSCAEVTAAIEAELGCVISQQPTSEYYAQVPLQAQENCPAQVSFSEW
jgi:hypothetical protein